MRNFVNFTLTLLLSITAASAQLKIPDSINLVYTKVQLENGLTVILHEDHKAPIVAVNVWYHVGSKNEPTGRNGFAHLFEHLMFQGSENFNDDYFKAMDKIGATDMNGTTNEDRTNYFQTVPATALDTALFMESDRMGHFVNAISQFRLDEQRKVVLNEKRQGENRPYWGIAEERIMKGAFPAGHPYSWTTIGSVEDLNAATLTDVKEWFKTYYGPGNATLTLVGDFKTADALEKVKKYFGDIPPGPRLTRMKEWIAKRTESKTEIAHDYVPLAKLLKVYNIPGITSFELDTLDVASDILSVGRTSRLYKDIVYDQQLASDITANVWPGEIASMFVVDATAKEGVSLEKLDAAIQTTFQNFFKQGPTSDELKRVKTQFLSSFVQAMEKIGGFEGKANLLASNQVFNEDPTYFRKKLDFRMNLSTNDIKNAAVKWLSSGDYNLKIYPFPKFSSVASTVDRKKVPFSSSYPIATFPKVEEAKLSNGMRILLARRTHIPTVEAGLMFNAGYTHDPKDKLGLNALTFDLLNEGTTKSNLFEIENRLANLGSKLSMFTGMNYSGVYFESLKQNLEATMDIMAETILHPAFPQKELTRLQKEKVEEIQQEKAEPRALASRILPELLYGKGHPYGVPLSGNGTVKTITSIKRDEIVNFFDSRVKPNNATLVAVGDITMDELKKQLEKRFGGWKSADLPKFEVPPSTLEANRGKMFLIDRPFSPQTTIYLANFFPSYNDPKEIPNQITNAILGGAFTSRINMNLREDKGWSYGARSVPVSLEGRRYWRVGAPVQTDKTDLAVAEIKKEILGFATQSKPITQDEFNLQKTSAILELSGVWETNGSLYGYVKDTVQWGLDPNFNQSIPQKLEQLTLNDVIASAKTNFPYQNMMWLLIGDKSKILPGLQKQGFKDIVILDEDGNIKK